MNELYLHLIWQLKRLPMHRLQTTEGQLISILDIGRYNTDSGPDFFNGKVQLDEITLVGNIEMHVKSSDWYLHGHHRDSAYDNVILHVVFEHDREVNIGGIQVPVIELKPFIDRQHYSRFRKMNRSKTIPCAPLLQDVPRVLLQHQIENSLISRLERKSTIVLQQYGDKDLRQLMLILVAGAFGMKTNALPFVELAQQLPLQHILRTHLSEVEAIVYGMSGLLSKAADSAYTRQLWKTWRFHQQKLDLSSQNPVAWKFKGCRPAGFPTLRLAQFSAFICHMDWSNDFWERSGKEILDQIRKLLCLPLPDYWQKHYDFNKEAKKSNRTMGRAAADLIVINAVVPFLNILAAQTRQPLYNEKAVELLELIPPEQNAVTEIWKIYHVEAKNAGDSQGLLELKHELCDRKQCLHCKVGMKLLGK